MVGLEEEVKGAEDSGEVEREAADLGEAGKEVGVREGAGKGEEDLQKQSRESEAKEEGTCTWPRSPHHRRNS